MSIIPENTIKIKAPAKINLSLDVTGRRNDGYHNLEMVMQTVSVYDELEISVMPETPGIPVTLSMDRELPDKIPPQKNLVYKAAVLMKEKYSIKNSFNIFLKKNIPAAAGLAGGSSDCAATLIAINRLCSLGLTDEELCSTGVILGADVPYCIRKGTMLCKGTGDILLPLPPLKETWLVLVKPDISVSTAYVYKNLDSENLTYHPDTAGMVDAIKNNDIKCIAARLSNVLETVTAREYPVINKIKKFLADNGAAGSLMSGSGPSVFGIFENKEMAESVFHKTENYKQENPEYRETYIALCHTVQP